MDMSKTIAPKSDQMNADDLIGGPKTITITGVRGNESADQPVSVYYEGDNGKPFKPCKSMRRVMVKLWGKDATQYAGKSMTLYCDPNVTFGGMKVGGIRISHMSGIDGRQEMLLTATRARKANYVVEPLKVQDPAPEIDEIALLNKAREAAMQGMGAYKTFWGSITPAEQIALKDEHAGLKEIAAAADAEGFDSE